DAFDVSDTATNMGDVSVSPNGHRVYVANQGEGAVYQIDPLASAPPRRNVDPRIGSPSSLAATDSGVYVWNGAARTILFLDEESFTVQDEKMATIQSNGKEGRLAITSENPGQCCVYLAHHDSQTVFVFNYDLTMV